MADIDAVTRESAIAAIEHVAISNTGEREAEAVSMLRAARARAAPAVPTKVTPDMCRVFRKAYRKGGFWADRLDYALDRMLAAAGGVTAGAAPDGWKLVPVEPTDQMVQAAHHIDLSYMPGQEGADRAAIYRAMLSAAPQPPEEEKKEGEA